MTTVIKVKCQRSRYFWEGYTGPNITNGTKSEKEKIKFIVVNQKEMSNPYFYHNKVYCRGRIKKSIHAGLEIAKENPVLIFRSWLYFFCCLIILSCNKQHNTSTDAPLQKIAFVNKNVGINYIYLMTIDALGGGKEVKRLTSHSEPENYPSCSPDGKMIVYQRDYNGAAIYLINSDGTGERRLSSTPGFDVDPSWSPDGTKIIYIRVLGLIMPNEIPKTEIHVMNNDGSGDRVILPKTKFSVEPRWSVRNQVVFMSRMNGGQQIFTMNRDGANIKQLTFDGNNGDPVWSPDGSRISFGSDREGDGKLNIFIMDADGNNVHQLTHFITPVESGDTNWSPDGKKITFEYDINGERQSNPDAFAEVWTMNTDGSGQLTTKRPCSCVGCAPRWLPADK